MTEHQRAAEELLARSRGPATGKPDGDPDLDAETTSAYIAGALSPEETGAFERRLADEDDLRATWVAATASAATGTAVAGSATRNPVRLWGIAALVLIAAGVFLATQQKGDAPFADQVATRLANVDAKAFSLESLIPGDVPVERNGLRLLEPRGVLLSLTPLLSWSHPKTGGAATVTVEDETSGEVALTAQTNIGRLAWPEDVPALLPGRRYLWRCEAPGPLGTLGGRAMFETASQELRETFAGQVRRLGTGPAADIAAIHLALRHSLWAEALQRASALTGLQGKGADQRDALATYARARLAGAGTK